MKFVSAKDYLIEVERLPVGRSLFIREDGSVSRDSVRAALEAQGHKVGWTQGCDIGMHGHPGIIGLRRRACRHIERPDVTLRY